MRITQIRDRSNQEVDEITKIDICRSVLQRLQDRERDPEGEAGSGHAVHIHAELKALKAQLDSRKRRLMRKLKKAEEFISEVDDSLMRTILTRKYLEGAKQKEIAEELNYSEARISQLINSFWLEQSTKH